MYIYKQQQWSPIYNVGPLHAMHVSIIVMLPWVSPPLGHSFRHLCMAMIISSTHNQRIERLWRDVHRCVVSIFSEIFYSLESEGLLDPLNETDLYCLNFIFLPRLHKCLAELCEGWNQHKLSSEGNLSLSQLFFEGKDYTRGFKIF